eukprot:TRINITY_DN16969_c0_g1_i1.p1 TRINITY_DN16969_c0_g1~~TRINITY_DN16969_c0_g1_i1.p1  ORF type:complete len:717 (+),score=155.83 TRINITY_DN16969_c0_g1_i1:292-2151(+)
MGDILQQQGRQLQVMQHENNQFRQDEARRQHVQALRTGHSHNVPSDEVQSDVVDSITSRVQTRMAKMVEETTRSHWRKYRETEAVTRQMLRMEIAQVERAPDDHSAIISMCQKIQSDLKKATQRLESEIEDMQGDHEARRSEDQQRRSKIEDSIKTVHDKLRTETDDIKSRLNNSVEDFAIRLRRMEEKPKKDRQERLEAESRLDARVDEVTGLMEAKLSKIVSDSQRAWTTDHDTKNEILKQDILQQVETDVSELLTQSRLEDSERLEARIKASEVTLRNSLTTAAPQIVEIPTTTASTVPSLVSPPPPVPKNASNENIQALRQLQDRITLVERSTRDELADWTTRWESEAHRREQMEMSLVVIENDLTKSKIRLETLAQQQASTSRQPDPFNDRPLRDWVSGQLSSEAAARSKLTEITITVLKEMAQLKQRSHALEEAFEELPAPSEQKALRKDMEEIVETMRRSVFIPNDNESESDTSPANTPNPAARNRFKKTPTKFTPLPFAPKSNPHLSANPRPAAAPSLYGNTSAYGNPNPSSYGNYQRSPAHVKSPGYVPLQPPAVPAVNIPQFKGGPKVSFDPRTPARLDDHVAKTPIATRPIAPLLSEELKGPSPSRRR